jgi:hypothetical protein
MHLVSLTKVHWGKPSDGFRIHSQLQSQTSVYDADKRGAGNAVEFGIGEPHLMCLARLKRRLTALAST